MNNRGRVIHAVILRARCSPPRELKSLPLGLKVREAADPPWWIICLREPLRDPNRAGLSWAAAFSSGSFSPLPGGCADGQHGEGCSFMLGCPGGAEH